mgnify:CR=1 FL=1
MTMRPIDIARRLQISTTTLRKYEDLGIIPPVERSHNGYRIYTDEHIAYFICIREMLYGFTLFEIGTMLKLVIDHKHDEALWIANKAQSDLQNDKFICEQIKAQFLYKRKPKLPKELTVDTVSKTTGIPASTIRYWDKIGLISVNRCVANNYRIFTQSNIDQVLMIQALKFAMQARGEKYAIQQIRKEMQEVNLSDMDKITALVTSIDKHLASQNRALIRSVSALYYLCRQIEEKYFDV